MDNPTPVPHVNSHGFCDCMGSTENECPIGRSKALSRCTKEMLDGAGAKYKTDDPETPHPPKSPVGIMPRFLHVETRLKALLETTRRYIQAGVVPLDAWIEESEELLEQIINRPRS